MSEYISFFMNLIKAKIWFWIWYHVFKYLKLGGGAVVCTVITGLDKE